MPRKKVIIIKPFIFTGQYMLPGDVRHEIRPIRMRYLQSEFLRSGTAVFRGIHG